MRGKPSSTNLATGLGVIGSALWVMLGRWIPRTSGSHTNALRSATVVLLTLLAFSLAPPAPSYAATLTVCISGCGFTTIATAIAAANPLGGDTISILDAAHTEANIVVDRNLTDPRPRCRQHGR
jgi:hypothetical protein